MAKKLKNNKLENWDDFDDEMDEVVEEKVLEKPVKLFEDTFTEDEDEIDELLAEYGY